MPYSAVHTYRKLMRRGPADAVTRKDAGRDSPKDISIGYTSIQGQNAMRYAYGLQRE